MTPCGIVIYSKKYTFGLGLPCWHGLLKPSEFSKVSVETEEGLLLG